MASLGLHGSPLISLALGRVYSNEPNVLFSPRIESNDKRVPINYAHYLAWVARCAEAECRKHCKQHAEHAKQTAQNNDVPDVCSAGAAHSIDVRRWRSLNKIVSAPTQS